MSTEASRQKFTSHPLYFDILADDEQAEVRALLARHLVGGTVPTSHVIDSAISAVLARRTWSRHFRDGHRSASA